MGEIDTREPSASDWRNLSLCFGAVLRIGIRFISDLHRAITGEALTSQTFLGYFKLWLAHKKPLLKSSSYAVYDKSCRKFIAFLGLDADRDISEITHEHLNRFATSNSKPSLHER